MFSNYEELLEYSKNVPNKLIVFKFGAKWCNPCKAIIPFVDYLQSEYPNIEFVNIDIEDMDKITIIENFSITKVPTFIYYKNGVLCETIIGTNKQKIEDAINDNI
jgi:thioredoxin 1